MDFLEHQIAVQENFTRGRPRTRHWIGAEENMESQKHFTDSSSKEGESMDNCKAKGKKEVFQEGLMPPVAVSYCEEK